VSWKKLQMSKGDAPLKGWGLEGRRRSTLPEAQGSAPRALHGQEYKAARLLSERSLGLRKASLHRSGCKVSFRPFANRSAACSDTSLVSS
jgi:hypothetical protein